MIKASAQSWAQFELCKLLFVIISVIITPVVHDPILTLSWSNWPHWLIFVTSNVALIRMNVSLISSRIEIVCVCASRLKVFTSDLRSLVFFCSTLKWLYTSGESVRSAARNWLTATLLVAGFIDSRSFSVINADSWYGGVSISRRIEMKQKISNLYWMRRW